MRSSRLLRPIPAASTLVSALACAFSLLACSSTADNTPASSSNNLLISDENNYASDSSLTIPTIQTAPSDVDICWTGATQDLQCHTLDPVADIDNVSLLRFMNLSQSDVAAKINSSHLSTSEVADYKDFHTDHATTCTKLSALSFLSTPLDVAQDFSEASDRTYLTILSHGTTPGVGARTMAFLEPSSASTNTRVDIPSGCGLLNFSATLAADHPVKVPVTGPWLLDWHNITVDSQGNEVPFEQIDGLLLGFYAGMTASDLEARILDLELIATSSWSSTLDGSMTANLAGAHDRVSGAPFPGFATDQDGVWMLALTCSSCQNPAPLVLTILEPTAVTP